LALACAVHCNATLQFPTIAYVLNLKWRCTLSYFVSGCPATTTHSIKINKIPSAQRRVHARRARQLCTRIISHVPSRVQILLLAVIWRRSPSRTQAQLTLNLLRCAVRPRRLNVTVARRWELEHARRVQVQLAERWLRLPIPHDWRWRANEARVQIDCDGVRVLAAWSVDVEVLVGRSGENLQIRIILP